MIDLDNQQRQALLYVAAAINRAHGMSAAMRYLRCAELISRICLSVHRFFAPKSFDRWNRARIAGQQSTQQPLTKEQAEDLTRRPT